MSLGGIKKYLVPLLFLGMAQKAATCAVALPVAVDSAIASVDIAAKTSGYDDKYRNNAERIINSLEDELHIKIRQPRIEASFFVCRQIMLKNRIDGYNVIGIDLNTVDLLKNYAETTKESLLMNSYISENLFNSESTSNAMYDYGIVCLAPYDRPPKPGELSLDETISHEIMHSYVDQVNPGYNHVNNLEEILIRRLVSEGIATYSQDFVFGDGRIILNATLSIPLLYKLEDLETRESLFYSLGTHFVGCAVDEVGLKAITMLAQNPPSAFEEIQNCKEYIKNIE